MLAVRETHFASWPARQRLHVLRGGTVDSDSRECFVASLSHTICLTWTHSKHYGFAGGMAFLLQKFCNLLIDRVRKIYIWVTAEKLDVSLMGLCILTYAALGFDFRHSHLCTITHSPCVLCLIENMASFGEEHQYDLPGNYPLLSLLIKQ